MNFAVLKSTIKASTSLLGLKAQKYSPELLVTTGIIATIGGTIMACKATLKSEEVLFEHRKMMTEIEEASEKLPNEKYDENDRRKDKTIAYTKTTVEFLKLYWPAITMYAAGVACILSGQNILRKRNIAVLGAYKLAEQGLAEYRARVVDELGEEQDFRFRYGAKKVTTSKKVEGKDGKKKTVKTVTNKLDPEVKDYSMYARLFEEQAFQHGGTWTGSSQFSPVHDYNYAYITDKMSWFNDMLNAHGFVFLNDVYEELGFAKTAVGQQVGWVKNNPDGDGYISFGKGLDLMAYSNGDPILLDFNVDGFVLDLI